MCCKGSYPLFSSHYYNDMQLSCMFEKKKCHIKLLRSSVFVPGLLIQAHSDLSSFIFFKEKGKPLSFSLAWINISSSIHPIGSYVGCSLGGTMELAHVNRFNLKTQKKCEHIKQSLQWANI